MYVSDQVISCWLCPSSGSLPRRRCAVTQRLWVGSTSTSRPPGRRTRLTSAKSRSLSSTWWANSFTSATPNVRSAKGRSVASPTIRLPGPMQLVLVEAAEPQRVGLEVDEPRVVARLREEPAAPPRAAADVDEPVAGRGGAEAPDEVDDVDDRGRAVAQELDVLVDVRGRALPDALLLHRLLDPGFLGRVVAHVDESVADGVEKVGGGGVEAVVTRLQRREALLAAERADGRRGKHERGHARIYAESRRRRNPASEPGVSPSASYSRPIGPS